MIEFSGKVMLFIYALFLALLIGGLMQLVLAPFGFSTMVLGGAAVAIMVGAMMTAQLTRWLMLAVVLALSALALNYAAIGLANSNLFASGVAAFAMTVLFAWAVWLVQSRYRILDAETRVHIIHVK